MREKMLILALDTTTSIISLCLFEDEKALFSVEASSKVLNSSRLFNLVDFVLSQCGKEAKDIDVIAVTVGPGSFTGVRVGIAAVKGMAYALKASVVAVSTLEAMAVLYPVEGRLLFPILDARRGQFYGALFRFMNGELERLTRDALFSPDEIRKIASSVTFIGEAAGKIGYKFLPVGGIAKGVGVLSFRKALEGDFTSLAKLKPVYLRPSDAEESKGIIVYR